MKKKYVLAIKFFTESKNEEQLNLSYDEIEKFMPTYDTFKFYFQFNISKIPTQIKEKLNEDDK